MNRDELFDKLRPIVMMATGIPECILADPNADSPNGVYASLEPEANVTERGQALIKRISPEWGITETVVMSQLINQVEINFYGTNALSYAKKLKNANRRPSVSAAMFDAGLGWNKVSNVSNLTALQANQREQRALVSLYVRYVEFETPERGNSIESVAWDIINKDNDELTNGVVKKVEPLNVPNNSLVFNGKPLIHNDVFLIYPQ